MGARSYADLDAEAGVSGEGAGNAPADAPHGGSGAEAPAGDEAASPSHGHGHDHEEKTGPDWKGDVCQCCGALLRVRSLSVCTCVHVCAHAAALGALLLFLSVARVHGRLRLASAPRELSSRRRDANPAVCARATAATRPSRRAASSIASAGPIFCSFCPLRPPRACETPSERAPAPRTHAAGEGINVAGDFNICMKAMARARAPTLSAPNAPRAKTLTP
jgi:hypothetical protein